MDLHHKIADPGPLRVRNRLRIECDRGRIVSGRTGGTASRYHNQNDNPERAAPHADSWRKGNQDMITVGWA